MHATHDNLSIPNGNMNFRSAGCAEFTISELLADPLTGALMRADRVEVGEFQEMLRSVARSPPVGSGAGATDGKVCGADAKPYPPFRQSVGTCPLVEFRGGRDAVDAGGSSR